MNDNGARHSPAANTPNDPTCSDDSNGGGASEPEIVIRIRFEANRPRIEHDYLTAGDAARMRDFLSARSDLRLLLSFASWVGEERAA